MKTNTHNAVLMAVALTQRGARAKTQIDQIAKLAGVSASTARKYVNKMEDGLGPLVRPLEAWSRGYTHRLTSNGAAKVGPVLLKRLRSRRWDETRSTTQFGGLPEPVQEHVVKLLGATVTSDGRDFLLPDMDLGTALASIGMAVMHFLRQPK